MQKYKIAIIDSLPLYYHVPIYQKLHQSPEIDLTVYYCSDDTVKGKLVEKVYMVKGKFVESSSLLEGYHYAFLRNYSFRPSILNYPFGLINLGIFSEILKKKYDLVVLQAWTNLTWFLAFFACSITRTPVAFMTDSNVAAEYSKSKSKILFRKLLLKHFLFKLAKGFLASGTANEEFYKFYGVDSKKIVRFPFSWGYEKLLAESVHLVSTRKLLREKYNVGPEDVVILYVGRFSHEKSLPTLLDAYHLLPYKNKKLFLVGDGPQRKAIEKKIKELKLQDVYFFGFQPRNSVLQFYAASNVLVLPSQQETWGIVINEAMCFNLPIIASDQVGAAVELVKEGENGFIFKAGDEKDLALKLKQLAELSPEKRIEFGQKSKEIIESWIKINPIEQIIKIIEN